MTNDDAPRSSGLVICLLCTIDVSQSLGCHSGFVILLRPPFLRAGLFQRPMFGKTGAPRLLSEAGPPARDSLVLRHLVRRGAGPIFRCESANLAHLAGLERDYRMRPASEHPSGNERRAFGSVGRVSPFPDALLRVQLLRFGERTRILFSIFAKVEGNGDRDRPVRAFLRVHRLSQAAQGILAGLSSRLVVGRDGPFVSSGAC